MFNLRSVMLLCTSLVLYSCSSGSDEEAMDEIPSTSDLAATLDLTRGGYSCYDVNTTMGTFTVALDDTFAPLHSANFKQYADSGYYDGVIFHNVLANTLIQTGTLDSGQENISTFDPVASEAQNGLLNFRGRLVATRNYDEPDSATSGFLININNNPSFGYGQTSDGHGLTVFGGVVAGMEIVDAISDVEVMDDPEHGLMPVEDVIITSVAAASCPAQSEPIEAKVVVLPYPVNDNDNNPAIELSRGDYACYNMVTSQGNIELAIDTLYAPATSQNFNQYVTDGFYDGLIFHRVIDNFMIQGGGLNASLEVKTTRDPIATESMNGLKNYRGRIAMARTSAPNSATSQFFINTVDNGFLNQDEASDGVGYTVFGGVINGMDVVDTIEKLETSTQSGRQDVPVTTVTIDSITTMDCPL